MFTNKFGKIAFRSDDTARSEIESRGEPEGGEDTPPPVNTRKSNDNPPDTSPKRPQQPIVIHLSPAVMENSGPFFRPIRDDILSRSIVTVPSSPTTPLSPSSSNVTGRGGTRSDYRRSTMEYVDSSVNSSRRGAAYIIKSAGGGVGVGTGSGGSIGEDRLSHLIDKLQIEAPKGTGEVLPDGASVTGNHIGAAAVAPALLLANHLNAPTASSLKVANGEVKTVSGDRDDGFDGMGLVFR